MLLELAIGDAYGQSFEYCDENLSCNNLEYIQNTKHRSLKPGKYTDDAQMSIAMAELIIENDITQVSLRDIARYFLQTFQRDRREGYSRNFQKFLEVTRDADEFLRNIRSDSDKSGSAMRSCPIGYIKDPYEVLEFASLQARLTHNTDIGVRFSQIVALSCNYFLHQNGKISGLEKFLKEFISLEKLDLCWGKKSQVTSKGNLAVSAALSAIKRIEYRCLSDLLKYCVAYGGDCDTTCTIALGIASCSPEFENDLPDILVYGLECGGFYGKTYLEKLDQKLIAKFL